jgi:hypothetical protein
MEQQMANDRMAKKLCGWKPTSTRLAGRPKIRWKDDMKVDLRILKKLDKIWVKRREVVGKSRTFKQ